MTILKWEDYLVLAITLAVSLGIGLFYSVKDRRTRSTRQFIFGDGNFAMIPVALSLMVSYESGVMMLGVPAEVYMYGMQWYMSIVGHFFGHLLTLYLLIPSQRKLDITSINQYIELRYQSHGLRMLTTILGLLASVNYLGAVLFVPAVTLEVVADIPVWLSTVGLMSVVMFYTIIGGFKAVVWTDAFQAFLMVGGMFAILIKGTIDSGGIASTWNTIREKGRINLLEFDPDPTLRQSFWSLFVGGIISGLRLQFTQPTFQRIKATSTVSSAKRMFFLASVMSLLIAALAVVEGAVMFAYYDTKGCDPLVTAQVNNQNQLIAKMVTDIFRDIPCLPGLFLAALFSASLSTMSSQLSSMSALFWQDIVKPHIKPVSDRRATFITRSSVLLFGGLGIVVAFLVNGLEGPISEILDITGSSFGGATAALFLLGWFIPRATASGAFAGGLTAVLVIGWISFGKLISPGIRIYPKLESASTDRCGYANVSSIVNTTLYTSETNTTTIFGPEAEHGTSISNEPYGLDVLYSLSYKWLTTFAMLIVIIVGSAVSYLQARRPVDPSLVVPVCDYFCVCLPEWIREKFRCGVKYPNANDTNAERDGTTTLPMIDTGSDVV